MEFRFIEARLIVPTAPNEGSFLNVNDYGRGLYDLETHIADCFGGFTRFEGVGAWVDGGRIEREHVHVYIIDWCDEFEDANAAFDGLREYVMAALDQRAVYLSHHYIEDMAVQ